MREAAGGQDTAQESRAPEQAESLSIGSRPEGTIMSDRRIEISTPSIPQVGSFVTVRGKTWIVEGSEKRGPVQALTLISCEDDSQGEAIELAYAAELQPEILDPNDWSQLLTRTFEGPQRLGAYLRSTE